MSRVATLLPRVRKLERLIEDLGAPGVTGEGWAGGWPEGQQFTPKPKCSDDDTGACCISGSCSVLSECDCQESGGDWLGAGTACDPNPCAASPCPPCPADWSDCIDGCDPDVGDCVHYVSFQVKLTQCDIDNNFSDLFYMNPTPDIAGHGWDIFADTTGWHFRAGFAGDGTGSIMDISSDDVPVVACKCYDIMASFRDRGSPNPIGVTFCVNGIFVTGNLNRGADVLCETQTNAQFGDKFGGDAVVNRKYRHMIVSPGFNSDTDLFDSLVDATVITDGGVNVLLVNSGSDPGYGEKDISWTIQCLGCGVTTGACCDAMGGCTTTTLADCTGTYLGDGTVCSPNPCGGVGTLPCCFGTGSPPHAPATCSDLSYSNCIAEGGAPLSSTGHCSDYYPCQIMPTCPCETYTSVTGCSFVVCCDPCYGDYVSSCSCTAPDAPGCSCTEMGNNCDCCPGPYFDPVCL